ncbi:sel1 repeat family protein [Colwellia piezophila]|uniref:sel1 repeat family protein n=1 Tax=Colwellia piezophila TaxID=211668 RepID=UPI00035EFF2E|nr:sel1 repeat family protein [Colwellia piezophila]
MTQTRIKLSLLFIILIVFLTTILLKITGVTPVIDSSNLELISSKTPNLSTIVKAEEITATAILKTKANLARAAKKNDQMVVMHRPQWIFESKLIVQLERLSSAAANGDSEASYILAMNLRYCYNSPIDDLALEKSLAQAYEFSDSEVAVAKITQKYEYCSGIEKNQRKQFYHYSQAAANDGYVAAQEVIGNITPEFFMESQGYQGLEREEFIIIRDNFIEQKIGFLQRAAQNGSIRALTRLSRMNRAQQLGGDGYVKSFGFNQLILELTQNNETYNRYSRYQQKLHSQLTAKEIDTAFAMSEQWLEIIKANGTLYLNEN